MKEDTMPGEGWFQTGRELQQSEDAFGFLNYR